MRDRSTLEILRRTAVVLGIGLAAVLAASAPPASASTPLVLTATPDTTVWSGPVTFAAQVPTLPGKRRATGTMTFSDAGGVVATVPLGGAGSASWKTKTLPVGVTEVTAAYSGDATYPPMTAGPVSATITKASLTAQLTAKATVASGTRSTFTARFVRVLPATGSIAGTATFTDGTLTQTVPVNASGYATWAVRLPDGVHDVTATYDENGQWATVTSAPFSQLVGNVPCASLADPIDSAGADTNCDGADGIAAATVFVSESGSDDGDCTLAAPCRTVAVGATRLTEGRTTLLVTGGTGFGGVAFDRVDGMVLRGGYGADFRSRAGATVIDGGIQLLGRHGSDVRDLTVGNVVYGDSIGVLVNGGSATLTRLDIDSGSPLVAPASTYGVLAQGTTLSIVDSDITAQAATDGVDGATPTNLLIPGTDGGDGTDGLAGGAPGTPDGGSTGGDGINAGGGGGTGDSGTGATGYGLGGGAGGDGGCGNCASNGSYSGRGGAAGRGGADGTDGVDGVAGTPFFDILGYHPVAGTTGDAGTTGGGGGGGGGGGRACDATLCAGQATSGGSGAKGGGGGQGGNAGTGGTSGGGAFGVYGHNASVTIDAQTSITVADGGDGGDGAAGQLGAPGGAGGRGGRGVRADCCTGTGGAGGTGGAPGADGTAGGDGVAGTCCNAASGGGAGGGGGGRGGDGGAGGGGAGGPSIAVLAAGGGSTAYLGDGSLITVGAGGVGGAGGGAANAGPAGVSAVTLLA